MSKSGEKAIARRCNETNPVFASTPGRLSLALGAAFFLHAVVIGSAWPLPSGASTGSAEVTAMRVRYLVSESPASEREHAANDAGLSESVHPSELAGPAAIEPTTLPSATKSKSGSSDSPVGDRARTAPLAIPPASSSALAVAPATNRRAQLPAAPDYLLGATLDPGPQPVGDINPVYPESANLQEGTVVIRILISDVGHVDNVAVVRAAPEGLFEEAAIEAFSKAEFTPGRVAGRPVKSQITVEVHFLPIDRGSRISGRGY